MTDPFFDLGKLLPTVTPSDLRLRLEKEEQFFEFALQPTVEFTATIAGDFLQIKNKTFKSVRFYETHFKRINFRNCEFVDCLFLAAKFEECEFHECSFVKCNTNKFKLIRTYLDPKSFVRRNDSLFDRRRYANVGVDLWQTLLKNSIAESQIEFAREAEFRFRLWTRYYRFALWKAKAGTARFLDISFFSFWLRSIAFQLFSGFGLKGWYVLGWTATLIGTTSLYNELNWTRFGIDEQKLPQTSHAAKLVFFTLGNLTNFGTAELTATTSFGLLSVSAEVLVGLVWIALCTAMIVKRLVR